MRQFAGRGLPEARFSIVLAGSGLSSVIGVRCPRRPGRLPGGPGGYRGRMTTGAGGEVGGDAGLGGHAPTSTIEWLELFFDLVVVAAVAVLTEGLREDPTWEGLGLFALLYAGVWFSWTQVVLYANLAGAATRTRTVVIGMFLVAVMAASAPIHFEQRANAFAVAFLVLRVVTSRSALRTGRILQGWPLLQFGGATLPWIVAIWVEAPWKYVLWAVGLGLDLVLVLVRSGEVDDERLARVQGRMTEEATRHGGGGRRGARERAAAAEPVPVAVVGVDQHHLQERLGLFVIIVLGEVVSQLVFAASTSDWTRAFVGISVAAFFVLVGLWWLTFSYGFIGGPHTRLALLPPRFGLPMHLLTTLGVLAMAAGFGEMAAEPEHHLGDSLRWIMCGGLSLHLLVMTVSAATGGVPRTWLFGWGAPAALAPLALAVWGDHLRNAGMLWVMLAVIGWLSLYRRIGDPRGRRASP